METTIEERKIEAIRLMKELDIFDVYIKGFEKNNDTCYYENYIGFWTYQDKELLAKQKEIEEKYNVTVFAITHEFTEFGELFDFLVVTNDTEDWKYSFYQCNKNEFYVLAYVWNKTDDFCSEFGTIGVKSLGGGIRRTA